ncbi:TPA: hypothetical protein ACOQ31_004625 [Bacillus cereus]|uniref:Uncharacterized protein n=1 Tax=Bacillus phage vB_BtS_BMBtp14 TaxID=1868826 RepID=A0A1B1P7A7_9CAUD|nr:MULTISPECIES: hypothetical protein [Bacillus cereus group]YP_009830672.1 hypothetical protein HWA95_gp18 [Bacillus phage vB_BtS_BMBtp14]ANT39978.1 hypothetical protein BMBtpLA2_18 [Bacillus phage vB_BtS_BMBtp14]EEM55863.1 hypothetical protein bthur0007_63230 [Bacillus thuringiensis serovar monterrey BGSC 4AJ1]MBL3768312.1 hypothetical protein [Bacillus cereus]MBL3774291.1 hypothetical protein [Bacillus cereus]MBL3780091.1 hypothetical protein [Bacillus cereus]
MKAFLAKLREHQENNTYEDGIDLREVITNCVAEGILPERSIEAIEEKIKNPA